MSKVHFQAKFNLTEFYFCCVICYIILFRLFSRIRTFSNFIPYLNFNFLVISFYYSSKTFFLQFILSVKITIQRIFIERDYYMNAKIQKFGFLKRDIFGKLAQGFCIILMICFIIRIFKESLHFCFYFILFISHELTVPLILSLILLLDYLFFKVIEAQFRQLNFYHLLNYLLFIFNFVSLIRII